MASAKGKYPTHALLYVLGVPDGPHKIGYSYSPKSRAKAMERAGHAGTTVVTEKPISVSVAKAAERYAHWLLREHHLDHEWFNVSREQAVAAVEKAVSPEVVASYHRYEMIPVTNGPSNKLKHGEYITTKYAAGTRERLAAFLEEGEFQADFIRSAVEAELTRRERPRPNPKTD